MAFLICNNTKLSFLSCQEGRKACRSTTHIYTLILSLQNMVIFISCGTQKLCFYPKRKGHVVSWCHCICGKTCAGVKIATNTHAYFKIAFPGIFEHVPLMPLLQMLMLWILNRKRERTKLFSFKKLRFSFDYLVVSSKIEREQQHQKKGNRNKSRI